MTDLRAALYDAAADVGADLEGAVLTETRRRRRRNRTLSVVGAAACVVLLSAGLARSTDLLAPGGPDGAPARTPTTTTSSTPDRAGPATQPPWDPRDSGRLPLADVALTGLLPTGGELAPDRVAPSVSSDPAEAVLVAWSDEELGTRLLGVDGRWRAAPAGFVSNAGTPYAPDAPVISSDGTRVAVALRRGIGVLDVTTGDTTVLPWPAGVGPPWDWAPGLDWMPRDEGLLVQHGRRPWVVGLDGSSEPLGYAERGGGSDLGIDPEGPVRQNDYRRSTLVTWESGRRTVEAPFPQCERLAAAYGLVACTTGSLGTDGRGWPRGGAVVVDPEDGDLLGYAPVRDRSSAYSDGGGLTTLGFLDADTVLLRVEPRPPGGVDTTPAFHLLAWRYDDGSFGRVASGNRSVDADFTVAPSLVR